MAALRADSGVCSGSYSCALGPDVLHQGIPFKGFLLIRPTESRWNDPAASRHGNGHRSDIDGLRAVAVVLVVLFHARTAGFEAGFVGVDVFFVISGFLITRLILDEIEKTGRLSLVQFWARRIRRLVPALTVMSMAVAISSFLINSPLRWGRVGGDVAASSLYVSNVLFAAQSLGYFEQASPSPLLHTWSLSVEEQFYLLWPLAIVAIMFTSRRARWELRSILKWLVPVACLASFGVSYLLAERGTPWAYYSLPTRWWEIGIGATVAAWLVRGDGQHRAGLWLGIAGACGIAASVALIRPPTPYPGLAALGPSLSTAALLAAGSAGLVQRLLSTPLMQWLGRRSYSWYLWHWPVLVFAAARGLDGSTASRLTFAVASLFPAMLSYSFVEQPMRFHPRLIAGVRPSLFVGGACVALGLLAAVFLTSAERSALHDPYFQALREATTARFSDYDSGPCDRAEPDECEAGSGPLVMLVGDSHAAQWFPAVSAAVDELGGRLAVRTRGGCPPWRVQVAMARTGRPSERCLAFLQETDQLIERVHPDLVVVASGNYSGRLVDPMTGALLATSDEAEAWRTGAEDFLRWLKPRTREVALILDNSYVPFDPVECLALTRTPSECEFSVEAVSAVARDRAGERMAARRSDITAVFDPVTLLCEGNCQTWSNGYPVFIDRSHLADGFVRTLTPEIEMWLRPLVDRRADYGPSTVNRLSVPTSLITVPEPSGNAIATSTVASLPSPK